MISPHVDDSGNLNIYVVSDSPETKQAQIVLSLVDLNGKILSKKELDISIEPLKGKSYFNQTVKEFLKGADDRDVFLLAELKVGGKTVSQNEYFFKPFKDLSVSKPLIKNDITPTAKGFKLTLSTDKLAKSVYLSGFTEGFFSDNYFNLIPNRNIEVEFQTKQKMSVDEFRQKLKVRSLIDAF